MSLKDYITVLPSNIQDELNAGSTCEECAEALSDYIIKLQADNKVLTAKVKELESWQEFVRYNSKDAGYLADDHILTTKGKG